MTLEQILKLDKNVKVGTTGGGFIYCGYMKDIDFDLIDRENVLKIANYISNCKTKIEMINRKLELPEIEYRKYKSALVGEKPMFYADWLAMLHKEKNKKLNNLNNAARKLANYKNVGKRDILEIYPSIAEPSTDIIIIEGVEVGTAWTTEEYERSKNETIESGRN